MSNWEIEDWCIFMLVAAYSLLLVGCAVALVVGA